MKILTAGSNKKLGMKFRPDDPFSRPLYASRHQATNLLLRVKKRYKKKAGSEGNEAQEEDECTDDVIVDEEAEYETELVGVLDSVYKFKGWYQVPAFVFLQIFFLIFLYFFYIQHG